MTKPKATQQKAIKKLVEKMADRGIEGGLEIADVAKKLHRKDALLIVPLYRGCMVVLKNNLLNVSLRGAVEIKLYHDPQWLGAEVNKENLPNFCETMVLYGQRSGPTITKDGKELMTEQFYDSRLSIMPTDERLRGVTKYKNYVDGGFAFTLAQREWIDKLTADQKIALYQAGYDVYPPVEMAPPARLHNVPKLKTKKAKKKKTNGTGGNEAGFPSLPQGR